jgi:two-component system, LuxR family, response regulator FixJ
MTTATETVFVVDDNPAVRRSLRTLFRAAGLGVETYASSGEFLAACEPTRSGCLVLDLQLRGESGLDLIDELRVRRVTLPVIVLTAHGSVPASVRALKAGAIEFFEKPTRAAMLLARVREALALGRLQQEADVERKAVERRAARLTPRERQVARLLLAGKRSKQIAAALGVSARTVEGHRSRLIEKMQVASATELVALLLRTRVVPPA